MRIESPRNNNVIFFEVYKAVLEKLLEDMEYFSNPRNEWIKSEFKTDLGSFDLFTRSNDQYVNLIDVTDRFISQLFNEKKAEEFVDRVIDEASYFHGFDITETGMSIKHVVDWINGVRTQECIA